MMQQRNFSSPEMLARREDAVCGACAACTETPWCNSPLAHSAQADLTDLVDAVLAAEQPIPLSTLRGYGPRARDPLCVVAASGLRPTQADLIDAGLAAGLTEEDVAMDDINGGGPDNPAQFAS